MNHGAESVFLITYNLFQFRLYGNQPMLILGIPDHMYSFFCDLKNCSNLIFFYKGKCYLLIKNNNRIRIKSFIIDNAYNDDLQQIS